jgi:hypothetical protein
MNTLGMTKTRLLTVCVALGLFATANPLAAQSTPTAGAAAKTISFKVGEIVTNPKTTTYSQQALINRTAGQPSVKAYNDFQGNLEAYHNTVRNGRNGKVMEAVFAHSENSRFAATGSGNRILVTAAEGMPAHAADLVLVDKNGRVLNQIQSKTGKSGWKEARKALVDPKYKGMSILTDQDSLNTIRKELLKAETTAARRGLPLAKEWKAVKDGLNSGRLLSRTPSGAPLPTLAHVEKQSVQALKKAWQVTAKQAAARAASGTTRAVAKVANANARMLPPWSMPRPGKPLPPWWRPGSPLPPPWGPFKPLPPWFKAGPGNPLPPVVVVKSPITIEEGKEFLEKISKRAGFLGKTLMRGLVGVGVVVEANHRIDKATQIEKDFGAGTINQQQREVGQVENGAGSIGGFAGAFYLGKIGAKAGSKGGWMGMVAGGVALGFAGYFGGEVAAQKAAGYLIKKVHVAGTTVADAAKVTKNGVVTAAVATKDGVVYVAKATANGVATAAIATKNGVVVAAVATKDGVVYVAKATANGVATAATATKNGVVYAATATKNGTVYAAKATANGVATAATATKNGVVYAATATKNGVVNVASTTGDFFKRGWAKFGW